ncbi:hypothetical protein F5Y15DRAFT_382224 [Xylariaceae sp. FL0016]|nr:hypothetical protein F5Y15DRAFT_382224 [Xylariaceae sp. FL0016]
MTRPSSANPGVFVTTPCWLQRTIDHIEEESPCQKLTLLFSKKIDKIEFHIEPSVRALRILRCHHSRESRSRVLISGSSTFGSVRLDEWQDRRHRHQLFLGDGVCINVNMQSEGTPWAAYVTGLSSQQKEQIYGHFLCMKRDNGEGPQWNQWKKHMAMVVGLLSGLDRIVYPFEVTPTGCFVEYRFGAAAYTPLSEARTVMSSAGAAYSLGPKVAAPVYFISWNSLMKWVRGGLWVVCQSYWAVLENLVQVVIGRLSGTPANIIIPTRPGIQRSKSSREGKRVSWKAREALVSHSYIGGH